MMENTNNQDRLHEINRYQDPMFPVGMYTVTVEGIEPEGRGHLDLHWHEELQLTMMLSGSCVMQVSGQDYLLQEGQAIFINRNLLHITEELSHDGKYFSINFPDELLGFFRGSRMEHDYVHPYTGNLMFPVMVFGTASEWHRKITADLMEIRNVMLEKKPGYQYKVSLLLTGIWYEMLMHAGRVSQPSMLFIRQQELMQKMLGFIHQNYKSDIEISDVAEAAEISEEECFRCFRDSIGISPVTYMIRYRVARAEDLLGNTDMSIEEVPNECGFRTTADFIDSFRDSTGMSPREFREKRC